MTETQARLRTSHGNHRHGCPAPVATMTLVKISEHQKILAGHDAAADAVWVLRKDAQGEYGLFRIPIPEHDQTLRSFVTADDSEAMELRKAIDATLQRPTRRRRRKKQ